MSASSKSAPPDIPGYQYQRELGSGGFADVYLYQQLSTDQLVAIKVLKDHGQSAAENSMLMAEAKKMASLQGHHHIVDVKVADVLADGRPYLVMSYFPRDNLLKQVAANGPFSVADTLKVGIQIGSAVEMAHRAGILHRDIKPANILSNQYDEPALTDFGIASNVAGADVEQSGGLSLPWSPPEAIDDATPDVRSDVYSLAATLWHLLVGRSPFVIPGGNNDQLALMQRIRAVTPPSLGRGDAPASLDSALRQAMSKSPSHRPATALDFVLVLRSIEQELRLPLTRVVVEQAPRPAARPSQDLDDRTRIRPVTNVGPQASPRPEPAVAPPVPTPRPSSVPHPPAHAGSTSQPDSSASADVDVAGRTTRRGEVAPRPFEQPAAETLHRPTVTEPEAADPSPVPAGPERRSGRAGLVAAGAVVIVAAVALAAWHPWSGGTPKSTGTPVNSSSGQPKQNPLGAGDNLPPGPPVVTGQRADPRHVRFSWSYDAKLSDDSYRWQTTDGHQSGTSKTASALVADPKGKQVCVQVKVYRYDGSFPPQDWSAKGCAS